MIKKIKALYHRTRKYSKEDVEKLIVYKRSPPREGIPFSISKSRELFKESLLDGYANSYFNLSSQFQTQSEVTYCGSSTMISVLNSLGVNPQKKWKG